MISQKINCIILFLKLIHLQVLQISRIFPPDFVGSLIIVLYSSGHTHKKKDKCFTELT